MIYIADVVAIYKITSPTGKIYIGQSWDIPDRKEKYKHLSCKRQRRLYNSLKKYGFEKHVFEVIHELPKDVTQEILDNYECLYMQAYKIGGFELLNLKGGGSNGKHSEESRRKMSESAKRLRTEKELEEFKARMRKSYESRTEHEKEAAKERGRKANKMCHTEKQRAASRELILKLNQRPRTEKQIEAGRKVGKLPRTEKQLETLRRMNQRPRTEKHIENMRKAAQKPRTEKQLAVLRRPRTEKQLAASRENVRKMHKLPRTEKQIEAGRKVGKLPKKKKDT